MEYLNQIKQAYNNLLNKDNLGRYGAGNIDLYKRPQVKNSDGSVSTVRSMSFNDGQNEVLIPTVSNDGRILSENDAIDKEYMEGVFNDAKNDIKRLSKQDYRNLGKKYYSNEFMPDGVYKENYGQIDFNNHNRGKDELQVLQNYPELKGNIQDAEYGFTSNHNNELDREYDHLIKADNKDVYDYVIERLDNGKNIYKMTDRLNKKKK